MFTRLTPAATLQTSLAGQNKVIICEFVRPWQYSMKTSILL